MSFLQVKAFAEAANTKGKPTCILAKTYKGRDFGEIIEDKMNWHGKAMGDKTEAVLQNLMSLIKVTHQPPWDPQGNSSSLKYYVSFRTPPLLLPLLQHLPMMPQLLT